MAQHGLGGPKKARVSQRLSHVVSFALFEENNQRLENALPKIHYIIHSFHKRQLHRHIAVVDLKLKQWKHVLILFHTFDLEISGIQKICHSALKSFTKVFRKEPPYVLQWWYIKEKLLKLMKTLIEMLRRKANLSSLPGNSRFEFSNHLAPLHKENLYLS